MHRESFILKHFAYFVRAALLYPYTATSGSFSSASLLRRLRVCKLYSDEQLFLVRKLSLCQWGLLALGAGIIQFKETIHQNLNTRTIRGILFQKDMTISN